MVIKKGNTKKTFQHGLTFKQARYFYFSVQKEIIFLLKIFYGGKQRLVSRIFRYGLVLFLNATIVLLKVQFPLFFGMQAPYLSVIMVTALSTYIAGWKAGIFSILLSFLLIDSFFITPGSIDPFNKMYIVQTSSYILESVFIVLVIHRLRKLQEQEHRERQKFQVTLSSIGDAVIATDRNGKITFMNPVAEKITGWNFISAREKKFDEVFNIVSESTHKNIASPIYRVLENGDTFGLSQSNLITREGQETPIDDCASPIKDAKGKMIGAVIIFRDMTAHKQLNEQRDLLLGITSHELKNIIAGMKAYAQLLHIKFTKLKDNDSLKYIEKLETKVDLLTKIFNDLIDVTKIRGGVELDTNEICHIRETIDDVVDDFREAHNGFIFRTKIKDELHVKADKTRVSQILINLISNSIKYSTSIRKIIVIAYKERNRAVICVRDYGKGIPRDRLEYLFQPFYRAAQIDMPTASGSGLGLYISSQIVKRYGGKIWVESKEGKGSSFYVSLPLWKKSHAVKTEKKPGGDKLNKITSWLQQYFP